MQGSALALSNDEGMGLPDILPYYFYQGNNSWH
jgi:hypothetical protein